MTAGSGAPFRADHVGSLLHTVALKQARAGWSPSTFIARGGYEHVAERLRGELDIDGYFLEYDTERAGGLEPLRFLPKGRKRVVLGLITSKSGRLESKDDIKRRIDEASRYVALDQ